MFRFSHWMTLILGSSVLSGMRSVSWHAAHINLKPWNLKIWALLYKLLLRDLLFYLCLYH